MTLLAAPAFIRETFGLRNVEVWNLQFADQSLDYCRRLRASASAARTQITNIQLDGQYNLSSADSDERGRSVAFVKEWIGRAEAAGAPSLRVNIDGGQAAPEFNPQPLVAPLRELAEFGQRAGVTLLVENHIGNSKKIDNCVALLRLTAHPNCKGLADWGNSDAVTPEDRVADIAKMNPYLALVSAKGLHFSPGGEHREYPIAPLVVSTERSGYRGIYSIELYVADDPPDPIMAVKSMIASINPHLN